jgi:hypothetical protein
VLARRLKHAVRLADAARFDAAITLVNETDYSVVSREALNGLAERAVSAEMRAVKLEEQFAALERDRGGEVR